MKYCDHYDENDPNYPVKPKSEPWHKKYKERAVESARRWQKANPDKCREMKRVWANNNREKVRISQLIKRFKSQGVHLTLEEYQALQVKQAGICAICGQSPKTKLVLDHNHETLQFRELLCHRCNLAVGWAEILQRDTDLNAAIQGYISRNTKFPL